MVKSAKYLLTLVVIAGVSLVNGAMVQGQVTSPMPLIKGCIGMVALGGFATWQKKEAVSAWNYLTSEDSASSYRDEPSSFDNGTWSVLKDTGSILKTGVGFAGVMMTVNCFQDKPLLTGLKPIGSAMCSIGGTYMFLKYFPQLFTNRRMRISQIPLSYTLGCIALYSTIKSLQAAARWSIFSTTGL